MRCRWNGIYATLAKFKLVMIAMQEVAHYLQIEALKQLAQHKDAFARSAYNRYYYACFLALRDAFAKMNSQWWSGPRLTGQAAG